MITLSIRVNKLEAKHFNPSEDGKKNYCSLRLLRRDDQYGNQWMATQSVSAKAWKEGDKGEIVGNGRNVRANHDSEIVEVEFDLKKVKKELMRKDEKGNVYLNLNLLPLGPKDPDLDADYLVRQDLGADARREGKKAEVIGIAHKAEKMQRKASAGGGQRSNPAEGGPVPDDVDSDDAGGSVDEDDYPF